MLPIADTLASLGSRLCIIFDPVEKRILYPRFGRFEDHLSRAGEHATAGARYLDLSG